MEVTSKWDEDRHQRNNHEIATDSPGRIRIVQFPALPKMTLLRIGVRLSERKDMKKYLIRDGHKVSLMSRDTIYFRTLRPGRACQSRRGFVPPTTLCTGRSRYIHAGE
jgi:hypothetical protein